jgi:hypothetical protein
MGAGAHRSAVAGTTATRRFVAVTLACAGLISACGSAAKTTYLDIGKVERAIEQSILSQRHLRSTVDCQPKVVQKPGKFACVATTFSAKKPDKTVKTPFLVTIHNDKGYVTYIGE